MSTPNERCNLHKKSADALWDPSVLKKSPVSRNTKPWPILRHENRIFVTFKKGKIYNGLLGAFLPTVRDVNLVGINFF